jgi:hypothetical protein
MPRHVLLLLHCRVEVQDGLVCELQEDGHLGDDLDKRSAHRSLLSVCSRVQPRNLAVVLAGKAGPWPADEGECGGQGRDRTADLAVFSRWTRGAAEGKPGNGAGQLACG